MKQAVLLGIGCNVQPTVHVPKILNALVEKFETAWLSRLVMTKPVGVVGAADFCNGVLYFYSELSEQELIAWCKQLEQQIGRTPQDCKSRQIADLDVLWCGSSIQTLNPSEIIKESYYQQPAQEVLWSVNRLAAKSYESNQPLDVLLVLGPSSVMVGDKPTMIHS